MSNEGLVGFIWNCRMANEIIIISKNKIHICRRGVWRLLGYQMVSRFPAVTQIHAHLEGEHYVTYPDDATPEMFLEIADNFPSSLMTYFRRATDALFDKLTHWTATNSSPSQSRRKNCQNRHAHHQGGS